ncbi:hypothetical protein PFICI_00902 [Pestalotiopsis fici W106-1]|uniref:Uncharacterized protein n=1 Tax=Pestalotiopsis fici (strain W106-1 / CGMCC3.15140) TaxID=1229662 RepID=W3XM55_PESFW|nr:uncharacterized protein PFICI_00902 [Pestalotiopsis fici W106-1]ETS87074.1 hypothetical protein PFICI_00902 [Pestalotiopsis fici W106-1]
MAPKKKAVTPEGHTDRESDGHSLQVTPPGVETITTVIGQVRERRTQIRQDIRRDFTNDVSQFKTRINQHYEAQETKRMEIARQQIRRLSEAIEKKAACEDKILKMIAMMANETDKLHSIMECVLNARQQLVLEAASSDKYKEKKR